MAIIGKQRAWIAAVAVLVIFLGFYLRKSETQSFSSPSQGWSATSGSIGGSLLLAGGSASGTISINGVQPGMECEVASSDGTNIAGLGGVVSCVVSSAGTVTVNVTAIISLTPAAKTYNVKVWQ